MSTGLQPISQSTIQITTEHGKLSIKNLEIASKIQLYTVSGMKIKEQLTDSHQMDILLPIGVYILQIGNYSEKVVIK
jgi:hypothetical protein